MNFYEFEGDPALEKTARVLNQTRDYRVLRRLPRLHELWAASACAAQPDVRLAVIDSETTGLGDNDKMIEFALVKMSIDHSGKLCEISYPLESLESPGTPLRPMIETITGLNDSMLTGKRFDEAVLRDQLADVDAIVAFNASFDARYWRARFPWIAQPWILRAKGYRLARARLCRTLANGPAGSERLLL